MTFQILREQAYMLHKFGAVTALLLQINDTLYILLDMGLIMLALCSINKIATVLAREAYYALFGIKYIPLFHL